MSLKMESHAGSTLNVHSCEMSEKYAKTLYTNTHKTIAMQQKQRKRNKNKYTSCP